MPTESFASPRCHSTTSAAPPQIYWASKELCFKVVGAFQHKLEIEGEMNSQRYKFAGFEVGVTDQGEGFSTHCARARDRKAETTLLRLSR